MKHLKKLTMTLALLLTAATGAWAQSTPTEVSTFADLQTALSAGNDVKLTANIQFTSPIEISDSKKITIDGNGKTMSTTSAIRAFKVWSSATVAFKDLTLTGFVSGGGPAINNSGTIVLDGCTISNCHVNNSNGGGAIESSGKLYAINTTFSGNYSSEIGGAINNYGGSLYLSGCTFTNNYTTSSNAKHGGAIGNNSSNTVVIVNCTFSGNKYGGSNGSASDLGVYRTPNDYTIAGCTGITITGGTLTTYQYGTATPDYSDLSAISFTYDQSDTPITPVDITWTAATKTATLTNDMPAGNVTVSVEYFPQATMAEGAVTAATGVKATTEDALVTIDETKLTGAAKMMYYASTEATAPAYDATGWTDQVPTAEKFTEAGNVNVWYYPVGTDVGVGGATATYSDGDMNATALTVTLGAAPTYAITLKKDTEESDKWDISPAEATKGTTITATYSGSKKVKSVKAVKKVNPNAYLKWDDGQKKLVETDIPAEVTMVQNADANVEWAGGTYVVEGNVTINGKIYLTGNVDLIIKDGAKLTATRINSPSNDKKTLSIYGQSKMNGELVINSTSNFSYAIDYLSTLSAHSAKVTANSTSPSSGGIFAVETINVYGGLLDAKYTGSDGYGIFLSGGGKMNIYGGEVKAASNGTGANSYGIMASTYDSAITVTVHGGKLWAESPGKTVFNTAKTTFAKGDGFTGKIETSDNGTSWTEYTSTGTPDAKYVRAGY